MSLRKYHGEKVIITTYDGEKYKGFIDVYLQPNDNDGEEGIGLDIGMWFDESDIKEISLDKRSWENGLHDNSRLQEENALD